MHLRSQKIEDLVNTLSLPVDEDYPTYRKCIPFDKLTLESTVFWWTLIEFCQKDEKRIDYVQTIIHDL